MRFTIAYTTVPFLIALAVALAPPIGIAMFVVAALSPVVVPVCWAVHNRLS